MNKKSVSHRPNGYSLDILSYGHFSDIWFMLVLLAGAKRTALHVTWSQEGGDRGGGGDGGGGKNKNEHNSVNFRATSSRFCM